LPARWDAPVLDMNGDPAAQRVFVPAEY